MTSGRKSKNHHWWPVGLQSYWADRTGDVSWIEPDGKVIKKRSVNRKIGHKIHGHTVFRGTVWESNFEVEFDVDNKVHQVIGALQGLKPFGSTVKEFSNLIWLIRRKDRPLRDMCNFYHLDEELHRTLLLFIFSLLIRSPRNRFQYEGYSSMVGLPPDEEVGKVNMAQNFEIAKQLCQNGLISNQYFVFLHSPLKRFIFGDGSLDWVTKGLLANRINGKALLPLTPHLCVYFCTPMFMRNTPNCASLYVAPWIVDWVNDITQIYSKDKLFYLGKPPKLSKAFSQRQFLGHKVETDELFDMLDEIAGVKKRENAIALGLSGIL